MSGEAWLDHEWSSEYLDEQAIGWDWIGINLDDGSALMAFRIRGKDGDARWAGASWRDPAGAVRVLDPSEVRFVPTRLWRSPRTAILYPVGMRVRVGARELGTPGSPGKTQPCGEPGKTTDCSPRISV